MHIKTYIQLLNELIHKDKAESFLLLRDKEAHSFWNRDNNYDEVVCAYINKNMVTLKKKDATLDLLKLYDELLVNNIITMRVGLVHPYNIFRIVWRAFYKYLPDEESYNRMYNNAELCYRFNKWSDVKRKKRRSYIRVKNMIFDILAEDYNMQASIIAERVDMPTSLVKRILLDDLRNII